MTAPADERFLDVKGLAKLLDLPAKWIYTAVQGQKIPHSRYGKYIRFSPEDVAAIKQIHQVPAAS